MKTFLASHARILGVAFVAAVLALSTGFDARAYVSYDDPSSGYEDVYVNGYDWDTQLQNAAAADGLPGGIIAVEMTYGYCTMNPLARVYYPWGSLLTGSVSSLHSYLAGVLSSMGQATCALNAVGFHRGG